MSGKILDAIPILETFTSMNKFVCSFLVLVSIWIGSIPVSAEIIRADNDNEYLQREFDWAMFLDLEKQHHLFNYQSSSLTKLTKVQINYKACPRGEGKRAAKGNSRIYEELWYKNATPIASKRHFQIESLSNEQGIIVLRKIGASEEDVQIAVNAVMRMLLDMQIKKMPVAVIAVPAESYESVADRFQFYRFSKVSLITESKMVGKQFSIQLQSYPSGKDERYYLQK